MKYFKPSIIAKILLVIFALAIALMLNACVTYKKCQDKFSKTITDSVTVTKHVTVNIPKDSIITSIKNDTVTFYKEIRQGRAKIIIERTPTVTYIRADCDSAVRTAIAQVNCPPTQQIWGVSPNWKIGFFVLLGGFIFLLICAIIIYFFKK